ncbi:MAG: hypothetical protein OQJ89_08410 [Kangiellaceae bacterium]|nr:hypothetical protein [Kangiellaceae bacterium]MCW9016971.1 hypothetical protein [Kangiellaceae bacterium]
MSAKRVYTLANGIIALSFMMMIAGAYVGFVDHDAFTIPQQVVAHISIMVGAGLLKLSYVMRLNASLHLKINDFAHLELEMPHEAVS